ncbi:ABC transporter G member 36, partial [Sarracenia purpurea var. burkii]
EMKRQGVTEGKLQLLREVTGAFRPGVLTALMGVSGAGKTTLMDVLAGRKTGGFIEGEIRISGFPKIQETFTRISGYCEQTDIHSPQVTVRESLIFSAFLRLPGEVNKEEKMVFVDEVMDLVELDNLKDAIVGLPGITGLSIEQRKRLTIAVELVANPSIIFMDEPTSGLDARSAAIVMRTVRNTVDTGRTVVCTIHQPSIDIFEAFDELLLMKRGGQVIYSGPLGKNSHEIIDYFEAIPGVPKINEKYNPATWMLEVSSLAAEIQLGIDFAELYKSSTLHQRNKALVKELSIPPPEAKDLCFPSQYSQSIWGQFKSCVWKQWWAYWRTPDYNFVRFLFTLATALLVGTVFWQIGKKRDNAGDLLTIVGILYFVVLLIGVYNCGTVQPLVAIERTVFYRERAAGMYSALPYALAQVVTELPYVLVQATCFSLIVYAMVGFQWVAHKFMWFFFITYMSFLYFTYYGMMAVSISPNYQVAAIFAGAFYSLFNLFGGFFIPRPRIPKWWIWYYWICPLAWTVYGQIVSQYGDVEDTIKVPGMVPDPTIKFYIQDHFGFESDFIGPVAGVLVVFVVFFAFMYAYCIRTLNFQMR